MVKKLNVVVIGGGGGASSLLDTLKYLVYNKKINSLTSLVTNADDGGSTGKIRQWYNTSAWGDITKNLLALIDVREKPLRYFSEALTCRFNKGDFKGHTLRNIVLAGISQLNNCNDDCAVTEIKNILGIHENLNVIPITNIPVTLKFVSKLKFSLPQRTSKIYQTPYSVFTVDEVTGQKKISVDLNIQKISKNNIDNYRISVFSTDNKRVTLHKNARKCLKNSDFIIISPGHTHGTILPALSTPGIQKYIKNKILIYVIPFFNRTGINHTNNWNCSDYIKLYNKYLKREPDYVIVNNKYNLKIQGHEWVKNDILHTHNTPYTLISTNLVGKSKVVKSNCPKSDTDVVVRSPIGFDKKKMLKILFKIFLKLYNRCH